VVLWTCVPKATELETVSWILARDTQLTNVVAYGNVRAEAAHSYCVKVKVEGLQPGTTYYYRFGMRNSPSEIGRTRTAATTSNNLKFAVVSCSSYEWGYFNAYRAIAHEKNVQAVIHLGDYIYEYEAGKYRRKNLPRKPFPNAELVRLQDYRSRYAQYHLDPDLQEVHRLHPFICIWDDHELANDVHQSGAQNHQPEKEGDWNARSMAARQAYFEWIPLEDQPDYRIRRHFTFGNLASLSMLDGRLEGRSKQVSSANDPARYDTTRHMLGQEQAEWLLAQTSNPDIRWKLIGNQVIFTPYEYPAKFTTYSKSMDMWEGYPVERDRILRAWHQNHQKNLIVLTGDVHCSFAFDLRQNPSDPQSSVGVEWVTPSISSSNLNEYTKTWKTRIAERWFRDPELNPHLNAINMRDHGYLLVELTPTQAKSTWKLMKNIQKPGKKVKKTIR
jgi:alkaline phosphatase D